MIDVWLSVHQNLNTGEWEFRISNYFFSDFFGWLTRSTQMLILRIDLFDSIHFSELTLTHKTYVCAPNWKPRPKTQLYEFFPLEELMLLPNSSAQIIRTLKFVSSRFKRVKVFSNSEFLSCWELLSWLMEELSFDPTDFGTHRVVVVTISLISW